jgi:hypothetical protein
VRAGAEVRPRRRLVAAPICLADMPRPTAPLTCAFVRGFAMVRYPLNMARALVRPGVHGATHSARALGVGTSDVAGAIGASARDGAASAGSKDIAHDVLHWVCWLERDKPRELAGRIGRNLLDE